MLTKNLCLMGAARSGKDTVADIICLLHPHTERYALADPIKQIVHALLNVSPEIAETQKELTLSYHISLADMVEASERFSKVFSGHPQFIFHEYWETVLEMCEFSKETHTFIFKGSLRELYQKTGTEYARSIDKDIWLKLAPAGALITDIRFDNEAKWFRNLGYSIVHVVRDTEAYRVRAHISEQALEVQPDAVIYNNKTLEHLEHTSVPFMLARTQY